LKPIQLYIVIVAERKERKVFWNYWKYF